MSQSRHNLPKHQSIVQDCQACKKAVINCDCAEIEALLNEPLYKPMEPDTFESAETHLTPSIDSINVESVCDAELAHKVKDSFDVYQEQKNVGVYASIFGGHMFVLLLRRTSLEGNIQSLWVGQRDEWEYFVKDHIRITN